MNCQHVKQLIPEWLDGEIDPVKSGKIEQHINTCPSCQNEVVFWQGLGTTLREGMEDIKAPPDFAAGVMSKLPQHRDTGLERFFARWKRSIAVAATFAVLTVGSASGYLNWGSNIYYKFANNSSPTAKQLVDTTPINGQTNPGVDNVIDDPVEQPGNITPENAVPEQPNPVDTTKEIPSTAPGNEAGQSESPDIIDDDSTETQDYVLLAQNRVTETSSLRVKVNDINTAQEQALNYINNTDAQYEVIGLEDSNLKIFKIIIDRNLSGQLLEFFTTLGEVQQKNTDTDDINKQYKEKFEQCNTLKDRAKLSESLEEKKDLQIKITSIEAELNSLDRQATTSTIVLWLES